MRRPLQWMLIAALLLGAAPASAADKTVGVIMSGNTGCYQGVHQAFVLALVKEGFDHHKVDTVMQMPSPDRRSWTNAARRLAVAEVSVLVTFGGPATRAAIREARGIPIVFASVRDPNALGIPVKNVTGISSKVPMTSLLRYLKKLLPFTRLAIVYNELEPDSVRQAEELAQLESQYGFQTVRMTIKRPEDAKKLMFTGKADAVLISVSAVVNEALDVIVKSASAAKVPTISQTADTAEHGVVLSLAASATEQGEEAARFAARILRGENPAAMHTEFPKRVELLLNLKEAGALGIKAPVELITDATKVIK
jgi:putative ABC transport system substrate-binding protein